MNARFSKLVLSVVLIVVVVLGIVPLAGAQEGPSPEAVGLRPDAPPYALHGPYWVGTREFVIEDNERPLPVTVWYPALNPDRAEEVSAYTIDYPPTIFNETVAGHAVQDAAVDVEHGPYPLVIFSHGLWVFRASAVWLTEHLASHGFVVMALDHTGDTESERNSRDPGDFLIYRPLDITRVIDYADALTAPVGALSGVIDIDRVAVAGHSFGGYTALEAAGARLDFADFEDVFCGQPGMEGLCGWLVPMPDWLAGVAGLEAVPEGLWPSLGDPRVDAIVPFAPGVAYASGQSGLEVVEVPMLQVVGSGDTTVPPEIGAYWVHDHVGSSNKTLVVFENANHTIFENACDAVPWMELSRCTDAVWDFDRAHDLINHFTTAFLLAELYGDADAAAALAPDAVQFPGITYETTGY